MSARGPLLGLLLQGGGNAPARYRHARRARPADHPDARPGDHRCPDQAGHAARLHPERARSARAHRRDARTPGRHGARRGRLRLRARAGRGQYRERGGARHAGAARAQGADRRQRLLRRAPEGDRRGDRRAVRGARAAVDRAGHGRAARCRARGRCRDQPRDRLPRRHRHRPAQSDRAAGRGGQTARRRADRGRDRVVRRSADRCRCVGSRGDRRIAEQMARRPAGHRPRGREAHGARRRGRPGALVLPGSASAMAELRARRALAVHAAGPGHRRPGRGPAPA